MVTNVNNVVSPIDKTNSKVPAAKSAVLEPGKDTPVVGKKAPVEPPPPVPIDLQKTVEQLAEFINSNARGLSFRVDQSSGRTVVTVLNPNSGEVIRQIPSEEFLQVADALRRSGDLRLVDKQA